MNPIPGDHNVHYITDVDQLGTDMVIVVLLTLRAFSHIGEKARAASRNVALTHCQRSSESATNMLQTNAVERCGHTVWS